VGTTVVRGDDLDVLDSASSIPILVLDSRIRQLNVPVLARQLTLLSPTSNCLLTPFGRLSTLATGSVLGLQEALVLALQLLLENDPMHSIAALRNAVCSLDVRPVDSRVVGQLAGLRNPDVKGLTVTGCTWPATLLENRTALTREGYEVRPAVPHHVRRGAH
jgi:hypothetical protein